jgi:hypothetical protein
VVVADVPRPRPLVLVVWTTPDRIRFFSSRSASLCTVAWSTAVDGTRDSFLTSVGAVSDETVGVDSGVSVTVGAGVEA